MNVMKLNIIPITLIILLCSSLCVAEVDPTRTALIEDSLKLIDKGLAGERISDYPVKRETRDELSQLIDRFNDLENDITSLQVHEAKGNDGISESLRDLVSRARLEVLVIQSRESMTVLKILLDLEEMHSFSPQYSRLGLYYIKGGILKTGVPRQDFMIEAIDGYINFETTFKSISHSSYIIMSDKLKEYIRESKRLMQKIIGELDTTIKVIETKESNP